MTSTSAGSCTSTCATAATSRRTARATSPTATSSSRRSARVAAPRARRAFHVFLPGETICRPMLSPVSTQGLVAGVLIGEGSFGGDGKQPQITLRMHMRHEALFRWLDGAVPAHAALRARTTTAGARTSSGWRAAGAGGGRPAGPRGGVTPELDAHAAARLDAMRSDYADYIARVRARGATRAAPRRAGRATATCRRPAPRRSRRCSTRSRPTTRRRRRCASRARRRRPRRRLARRARARAVREARTIADLGAGAGFPGLALAAALPEAQVAWSRASGASARSSSGPIAGGGPGATPTVVCARAEEWRRPGAATSSPRARWRRSPVLVEYAAPLLRDRRRAGGVEGRAATPAEEADGGRRGRRARPRARARSAPCSRFPGADSRTSTSTRRLRTRPTRFPRRPGMARKRPLGRST